MQGIDNSVKIGKGKLDKPVVQLSFTKLKTDNILDN